MARSRGQQQHRDTIGYRSRRPNLDAYYRKKLHDIEPGAFEFHLSLLRGQGLKALSLDSVTETLSWSEGSEDVTASLSLRRPEADRASTLPVAFGMRVRNSVRWKGTWYQLWELEVTEPPAVDGMEGTLDVVLGDPLTRLKRNKRDWSYRKTKRRKRGYFADEVTRAVCKKEGVKVGKLAKCTKRFDKLEKKKATALDMIKDAWAKEAEETGVKYVIRFRNGRLEVVPYARNPILYALAKQIETAQYKPEQKRPSVTVLKVKARVGQRGHTHKVQYTYFNKTIVRRFGKVVEEKDYGRVKGATELHKKVKRDYARGIKVTQKATLSHPLIPFIHRGDGIKVSVTEPGWHGGSPESRDRSFAFVGAARFNVTAQEQRVEVDVVQDDPFLKDQLRLDEERRKKAKQRRGR